MDEEPAVANGDIKTVKADIDEFIKTPVIGIVLNKEGSIRLKRITKENVCKPLAIVMGKKIVSIPTIQQPIENGEIQISGNISMQEVKKWLDK